MHAERVESEHTVIGVWVPALDSAVLLALVVGLHIGGEIGALLEDRREHLSEVEDDLGRGVLVDVLEVLSQTLPTLLRLLLEPLREFLRCIPGIFYRLSVYFYC